MPQMYAIFYRGSERFSKGFLKKELKVQENHKIESKNASLFNGKFVIFKSRICFNLLYLSLLTKSIHHEQN